jgi:hypothetical protein
VRRVALTLLLFVLAVGGIYIVSNPGGQPASTVSKQPFYKAATNLQQPGFIDDYIYFYTGSSFARFDTKTGETQRLSEYFYTGGQITIGAWSKDSVLFSTAGTDSNDIFGRASQNTVNLASTRWWKYDFNTQRLQLFDFPLADSCLYMAESVGNIYCWAPIKASSYDYQLLSYNQATGTAKVVATVNKPVSSVEQQGNNILYVTEDLSGAQSLNAYDTGSGRTRLVYGSSGLLQYGSDATHILIDETPLVNKTPPEEQQHSNQTTSSKVDTTLLLLNMSGAVLEKQAANLVAGQITSSSDSVTLSTPGGQYYYVGNNLLKESRIKASGLQSLWLHGDTTYYIKTSNALWTDKGELSSLADGDSFDEKLNTPPNMFYISSGGEGYNNVYLNAQGNPFSTGAQWVDTFLSGLGFDPNQFNFNWDPIGVADVGSQAAEVQVLR